MAGAGTAGTDLTGSIVACGANGKGAGDSADVGDPGDDRNFLPLNKMQSPTSFSGSGAVLSLIPSVFDFFLNLLPVTVCSDSSRSISPCINLGLDCSFELSAETNIYR